MVSSEPNDLEWPEPQFTEKEAAVFAEERRWGAADAARTG